MTTEKTHRERHPENYVGDDRVTIDWVFVGPIDAGIDQAVARIKELIAEKDKHFAGLSVRWDGVNGRTLLCQVQYDDVGERP